MMSLLRSVVLAMMVCACGDAFTEAATVGDDVGDDGALVDAARDVGARAPDAAASDGADDAPALLEGASPDAGDVVDGAAVDAASDASTPPDAGLCCGTEHCGEDGEMFVCGASQHVCEQGCAVGDFCSYLGIASTVTPCP